MTKAISFSAQITKHLHKISDLCDSHNPDAKNNVGRLLGIAYFWIAVEKYAKSKKEEAWKALDKEGIIEDTSNLNAGEYALAESPHFYASAKVSQPVRRFDADELATQLNKKYKVPLPASREMIEAAKVPTKSVVTKSIVER